MNLNRRKFEFQAHLNHKSNQVTRPPTERWYNGRNPEYPTDSSLSSVVSNEKVSEPEKYEVSIENNNGSRFSSNPLSKEC
jgi:hypothetical protein